LNKQNWQDNENLLLPRNDEGFFLDVDGNEISFFGDPDLLPKGTKLPYTEDMLIEIAKCRDDIIYFTNNYFKAMTPHGFDFVELYDFQEETLKSWEVNYKNVLMESRQMGKCQHKDTLLTLNTKDGVKEQSIGDLFNESKLEFEDNLNFNLIS